MHTANTARTKISFFTPFNFHDPENDERFDELIREHLTQKLDADLIVDHVVPFEATEEEYERIQRERILTALKASEEMGHDAFVVACHYDPCVEVARADANIPVIAPLQITTSFANQMGNKFAVISDLDEAIPVITDLVDSYGFADNCSEVLAIGFDGDKILGDLKGAADAVDRLVESISVDPSVKCVVIGCTIVSAAYEKYRSDFPVRSATVLDSNLITVKSAAIFGM